MRAATVVPAKPLGHFALSSVGSHLGFVLEDLVGLSNMGWGCLGPVQSPGGLQGNCKIRV